MEPSPPSWTDLFKSERAIFALALIIAATVLAAIGTFTSDQWKDFTQWIATVYIGGKSVTGVAALIAGRPATPTVVATPPAVGGALVVNNAGA